MLPPTTRKALDRARVALEAPGSFGTDVPKPFRTVRKADSRSVESYWDRLGATDGDNPVRQALAASGPEVFSRNIENLIGAVTVPVGIAGPLRVNGINARGDFPIPMATTEAALVASYSRGARAITASGGAEAAVLSEGVVRTPAFLFDGIRAAGEFVDWIARNSVVLKQEAERTTRHGEILAIEPMMDSNIVFLRCRYATGDASGQNMVTIATDALCRHVVATCPVRPVRWYVEGNHSGDKKASWLSAIVGRGRKVSACVTLSGQIGVHAHFANALAALYIATGQDAACVAEGASGITRMEPRDDGLFCSVTLPNIMVGTVGGGTGLPTQARALEIMGLGGEGKAPAFAEVVAATCLAGEISIVAAIAAGHFTHAHASLARER